MTDVKTNVKAEMHRDKMAYSSVKRETNGGAGSSQVENGGRRLYNEIDQKV